MRFERPEVETRRSAGTARIETCQQRLIAELLLVLKESDRQFNLILANKESIQTMHTRTLRIRARPAKPSVPMAHTSNKALSPRKKAEAQPARSKAKAVALGDLSLSLGYRIRRAQLWVFREVSQRLAPFDISPAQFSVLSVIDANSGVNQLAIAQVLSIERAGLGRMVDHLERRGLVTRAESSINRRYYVLRLTREGAELLGRLKPMIAASEKSLLKKMGSRAYKQFQRTLSIFLEE